MQRSCACSRPRLPHYTGKKITCYAAARNSNGYIALLADIEADNLSSHNSLETRTWLTDHPRIQHVVIPKGAYRLNLQEGWLGLVSTSFDAMRSLDRVLPMPVKLSERCRWRRCNSTTEPNPGFGDGLPERGATCIASFLTAFEEQSTKRARGPVCIPIGGRGYRFQLKHIGQVETRDQRPASETMEAKTQSQPIVMAAMLNAVRGMLWFDSLPRAQTRQPAFVRLYDTAGGSKVSQNHMKSQNLLSLHPYYHVSKGARATW
ncbi:hypothetical protein [Ktedonobacter racemifer]|uniref:hypothetical protein n=1 Tax=Ktedonobacter racemifer TaxID=363277 RepID=UPI001FCBD6BC|nr:hypothetical protein [Ktedonobacter racemifer]